MPQGRMRNTTSSCSPQECVIWRYVWPAEQRTLHCQYHDRIMSQCQTQPTSLMIQPDTFQTKVRRKDDQTLLVFLTCRESWRGLKRCLSGCSLLSSSSPSLLLLCCSSSFLSLSLLLCARAVRGQKELTAAEPPLPFRDLESCCTEW